MLRRTILALALLLGAGAATAQEAASSDKDATAVFAGGCFWCMVHPFEALDGVVKVTSGYTGGDVADPTYEQVSAGGTGHAEAVEVVYDPAKVGYDRLLDVYWRNVDPFAKDRQFCDVGHQYRSAIFPTDEAQRKAAEASKEAVAKRFGQTVETTIEPFKAFYPAEDYHQ
ncbi:MAG: peptide-methionine (S)-S-oxide reductase MsrA, partial [Geminicoccaceae bacterium]|nr:peptide-methionine (S)-S-oxide reductase MsrA [Geminicoccaceae bacterium]